MKTSLLAVAAALLAATSVSAADAKQYGSAKLVYSDLNAKVEDESESVPMKTAYGLGLGYGVKIDDFRVEGELTFRGENKLKDEEEGDGVTNHSLMVNGYYDIATGTAITPYAGLGLGLSQIKTEDKYTKFAYGASIGAAYNVSEKVAIDLGYTYTKISDIKEDEMTIKLNTSEIKLGARFAF